MHKVYGVLLLSRREVRVELKVDANDDRVAVELSRKKSSLTIKPVYIKLQYLTLSYFGL